MRSYVDGHPVELTPSFRVTGKGSTLCGVTFSVPLRGEDLITILYTSTITTDQLADADAVRQVIAESIVHKGVDRLTDDKAKLRNKIKAGTVDRTRLAACKNRIGSLFAKSIQDAHARSQEWANRRKTA